MTDTGKMSCQVPNAFYLVLTNGQKLMW